MASLNQPQQQGGNVPVTRPGGATGGGVEGGMTKTGGGMTGGQQGIGGGMVGGQQGQGQQLGQYQGPGGFGGMFGAIDPLFNSLMNLDPFSFLGGSTPAGTDALGFPRFGELTHTLGRMQGALMRMDVKENDREFLITADVPGTRKEDVKIEVDDRNVLHMSTERRDSREESGERQGWTFHRVERTQGGSYRALRLPQNVDVNRINARVENGMLLVSVPKTGETAGAGRKRISVA